MPTTTSTTSKWRLGWILKTHLSFVLSLVFPILMWLAKMWSLWIEEAYQVYETSSGSPSHLLLDTCQLGNPTNETVYFWWNLVCRMFPKRKYGFPGIPSWAMLLIVLNGFQDIVRIWDCALMLECGELLGRWSWWVWQGVVEVVTGGSLTIFGGVIGTTRIKIQCTSPFEK